MLLYNDFRNYRGLTEKVEVSTSVLSLGHQLGQGLQSVPGTKNGCCANLRPDRPPVCCVTVDLFHLVSTDFFQLYPHYFLTTSEYDSSVFHSKLLILGYSRVICTLSCIDL